MVVKGTPNALNVWVHLVVMLYAVIMRFDSLREITASLLAEARKLRHLGITFKIGRSTLADANKRRPEIIFEAIYRQLYGTLPAYIFFGQPETQNAPMDETLANNRLHHHHLVFQPALQGCWTTS